MYRVPSEACARAVGIKNVADPAGPSAIPAAPVPASVFTTPSFGGV
jgi:hypothetical protein